MPNGTYGGVRGRKTKVGRKLLRFPPTRLMSIILKNVVSRSKALTPVLKLNEGAGEGVVNHPEAGEGWSFTLKAA